jgi:hypothetical protein
MKVFFKPPQGSSLESLSGKYEIKEDRLTLIVPMEGHTEEHPSVVYISAVKEHCEGV